MEEKQISKQSSLKFKAIAVLLVVVFSFQSLQSINSHTYTVGVDSFHYQCGCFGCFPTHFAIDCNEIDCIQFKY